MFIYIDWNDSETLKSVSTNYPSYSDLHLHYVTIRDILDASLREWFEFKIAYSHDEFTISIIDGYVPELVRFMRSVSEYIRENVPETSEIFVYIFYILMNKLGEEYRGPSIHIPKKYERQVVSILMSRLLDHPIQIRRLDVIDVDSDISYRIHGEERLHIPAIIEIGQSDMLDSQSLDMLLRTLILKSQTSVRTDLLRAHIKLITGSVTECRDICHLVDNLHMLCLSHNIIEGDNRIEECLRSLICLK